MTSRAVESMGPIQTERAEHLHERQGDGFTAAAGWHIESVQAGGYARAWPIRKR